MKKILQLIYLKLWGSVEYIIQDLVIFGNDHVRFTFLPNNEILETVYNSLEEFLG